MSEAEVPVLLPATVAYYSSQLTEFIERDRVAEAILLLRFLVKCEVLQENEPHKAEWKNALELLESEFPQVADEEIEDEREMRRRVAEMKAENNITYVDQMAVQFLNGGEQQAFALDQLSLLNYERLTPMLLSWLQEERDTMIQWMALQVLRQQGLNQPVEFVKHGIKVTMEPSEIPLTEDDYPLAWRQIGYLATEVASHMDAQLADWVGQTWMHVFISQFGTPEYSNWIQQLEAYPNMWACAVHFQVTELVNPGMDFALFAEAYELQDVRPEVLEEVATLMKTLK